MHEDYSAFCGEWSTMVEIQLKDNEGLNYTNRKKREGWMDVGDIPLVTPANLKIIKCLNPGT